MPTSGNTAFAVSASGSWLTRARFPASGRLPGKIAPMRHIGAFAVPAYCQSPQCLPGHDFPQEPCGFEEGFFGNGYIDFGAALSYCHPVRSLSPPQISAGTLWLRGSVFVNRTLARAAPYRRTVTAANACLDTIFLRNPAVLSRAFS